MRNERGNIYLLGDVFVVRVHDVGLSVFVDDENEFVYPVSRRHLGFDGHPDSEEVGNVRRRPAVGIDLVVS